MTRSRFFTCLIFVLLIAVLLLTPSGRTFSQSVREVFVVNFPRIQRVEGTVTIEGPVRLSESRVFEGITVPPVKPSETTRLVDGGLLKTDGFPNVVLSLHGIVRGQVVKEGAVGAILIPEEDSIQIAFNEEGRMLFAMEAAARDVSASSGFFASDQPSYRVGFPEYRVLLYNTTDKTVTVDLHVYLTN